MAEKINHIFLVIDGNRRYAKRAGIPLEESYRLGAEKVTEAVKWILGEHDVPNLTIFGLALSNLKGRNAIDIMPILDNQEKAFRSWLGDEFFSGIKVRFIGEIYNGKLLESLTGFVFPKSYVEACRELERKTAANAGKTLNILIAYSGKTDALEAQRRFAQYASENQKNAGLAVSDIAPSFEFYEHSGPDIDLIIRTSETRPLSDGPAHLAFFSEFVPIGKFWPEIGKEDIDGAINIFHSKHRRYGD